jgi:hypothetical protein
MKEDEIPRPRMIRTLSEQHWFNATIMMINTGAEEQCAGRQGAWEFRVKKLPGTKVERITLLNNNVTYTEVKEAI